MITMKELGAPIRQWVPDWLGLICIFIVILPVTMLNGSYTGSMLEVSNTLGTNTEDITMGYYAAAAGMAVSYPIIPKILEAFSIKFLLLADLVAQFFLSWICARSQNADILIVCSFAIGFLKGFLMLWFIRYAQKIFSPKNIRSQFLLLSFCFRRGTSIHACYRTVSLPLRLEIYVLLHDANDFIGHSNGNHLLPP